MYETALRLAEVHGLPKEKIAVSALLHDCGREVASKDSVAKCQELGLPIDAIEMHQPILLHAKLGVYNAMHKYGVADQEILDGIMYHTTGIDGMSKLAKVVYLADMIEPGRDFPGVEELRKLAPHSDTSFVLDTLEYMWKGGRCSGVAALGANVLKLKPCLEMQSGKLTVCKKYRGSMEKVYRQYITERLAGKSVVEDWAFITHSGEVSEQTLQELTELVKTLAPFKEVFVTQAGCTVSSHCGPGTLGVLFLRAD